MAQFSDDFNRANGSVGSAWTISSGTWAISSNRLVCTEAAGVIVYGTPCDTADHYVEAELGPWAAVTAEGIFCRRENGSNYYYLFRGQSNSITLGKFVGGVFTNLSGIIVDNTVTDGCVLRLVARGSTIEVWIDGALKFSVVDTDLTAGRLTGLRHSNGVVNIFFDNFSAADLSSGRPVGVPSTRRFLGRRSPSYRHR